MVLVGVVVVVGVVAVVVAVVVDNHTVKNMDDSNLNPILCYISSSKRISLYSWSHHHDHTQKCHN